MNPIGPAPDQTSRRNEAARERMLLARGEPLFLADWDRTLMLHYEIAPEMLLPFVPFELDLWNGRAHVSLVAFTMRGLRPRRGGWITRRLFAPIATHEFLNVRAYVTHGGEPGIYFLAEWLPNALSVLLGRPLFGLPYRLGRMRYDHGHECGLIAGEVVSHGGCGVLRYRARIADRFTVSPAGSRTEFLMERYSAFTEWNGFKRRFRVWHEPWRQCEAEAEIGENTLMARTGSWAQNAHLVGANYSPGLRGVWMGRPVFAGGFNSQITNHTCGGI